jgi:hypothetical protein
VEPELRCKKLRSDGRLVVEKDNESSPVVILALSSAGQERKIQRLHLDNARTAVTDPTLSLGFTAGSGMV